MEGLPGHPPSPRQPRRRRGLSPLGDTPTVLRIVRRIVAVLALTLPLTACAAPAGQSSLIPSRSPLPSVTASANEDVAPSEPSVTEPTALEAVLPRELDGVELHTFAVGEDILARLAAGLGVTPDELETAFASDHGARFLQMYAIRLRGATADALADGWSAAAYPPDTSDVTVADETVDGRTITVVDSPSARSLLGTFYLDPRGDTLVVVQAFDFTVAVEGLASLP